jgi:SAM-dependent methyltransferase
MANVDRDWDERYRTGATPWDSQLPSRELLRLLETNQPPGRRVLELGCGTGTNAVALAQRGDDVTAVDYSPTALAAARHKAAAAGVAITWIEADVQNFAPGLPPFDLVFDRGCYHCCRRTDLASYLRTLEANTQPGSMLILLAGNADEAEPGPPRVTATELCEELEPLFRIQALNAMRFEDAGHREGPLGWSLLAIRRAPA